MITIAIAEDHIKMREGIIQFIEFDNSLKVIYQADNGHELIKWLEGAPVLPDLCISDVNMPVMGGEETVKQIIKRWPEMKVLMLSTENRPEIAQKMINAGARGYMLKGTEAEELHQAIKAVIETGYYTNPDIAYKV